MENSKPVIAQHIYGVSPQTVWAAITELEQMKKWYFDNIPAFVPEVGFETRFTVESNGNHFLHIWKITEVVPFQKIAYSWQFEGYDIDSKVVFELEEQGDKTLLTLRCHGIESYPDDIPEFTRESCQAGWNYFIKESLGAYLEKSA